MSAPEGVLVAGLVEYLNADAGVLDALGGNPKVHDWLQTNIVEPYVQIGAVDGLPSLAECIDGTDVEITFHAWSRTDPPGRAEAMAIIAALVVALTSQAGDGAPPPITFDGFRLASTRQIRSSHLFDPGDVQTAHSTVTIEFVTEPL